jgi:uncharacterized membrane protein YgdD (TMEM256/DUF423 family)
MIRTRISDLGVIIALIPRPTPLPGDITDWLETFAQAFLGAVPPADRRTALSLDSVAVELAFMIGPLVGIWAATRWPEANVNAAGWAFIAGIIIFSGTLYLLSVTGLRWLGAITPIGGLAFLAGWAILVWSINR